MTSRDVPGRRRRDALTAEVAAPALADLGVEGDLVAVHVAMVAVPGAASASRTGGVGGHLRPCRRTGLPPMRPRSDQPELLAAHDGRSAARGPELGQDVGDVPLRRPGRDPELLGELRVAGACCEEPKDVTLPAR